MKKIKKIITALLLFSIILSAVGCSKKDSKSLVGVWEYADAETDLGAIYDLKDDGTGTYTMIVGETKVTYELKYEVKDGHLLVRYVNNETFTEDDVFDSPFSFKDDNTLVIKDSNGTEMEFVKK